MDTTLEVIIKTASFIAIIATFVRMIISITNRSVLEIILISNTIRVWEEFVEILFVVLILLVSSSLPSLVADLVMTKQLLDLIMLIDFIIVGLSFLIIAGYWLIYLFTHRIKKCIRVINISIFTNMLSLFITSGLVTNVFQSEIIKEIKNGSIIKVISIFGLIYIFYTVLFYFYRNTYQYFNGRRQVVSYKVEISDVSKVNELYFVFALDTERQIFTTYPVNKKGLILPAYVFYPKEQKLYKYYKE